MLLGLGAAAIGWSAALPHLLAAVVGATLTELAVTRASGRPLDVADVGIALRNDRRLRARSVHAAGVTAVIGVVATLSKHLLTTRRWHLFNPARLALLVSVPLFGTGQSWWGALPDLSWPFVLVLLAGGTFIVDRMNKAPLVLAFLGTSFGLFTALSVVDPGRVAELFRAPFLQATLFLALFMLTDPPTSPSRNTDQVVIGVLVGAVSCVAQLLGAGQSYLLLGLLAGTRRSPTCAGSTNASGGRVRLAWPVPESAFDRAGQDALGEVALQERVDDQDRHRGDHHDRHLDRLRGRRRLIRIEGHRASPALPCNTYWRSTSWIGHMLASFRYSVAAKKSFQCSTP